jgi:hypothetical protein
MSEPTTHKLAGDVIAFEPSGIICRCSCGWTTGHRGTPDEASKRFLAHQLEAAANPDCAYVNHDRVQRLSADLNLAIKQHYERGPQSRTLVTEVLNALAHSVALVAQGTDPDQQSSLDFFNECLSDALISLAGVDGQG